MTDQDFQLEVVESLTALKTDVGAIKDHLVRLNGSVAKAHEKIEEQRKEMAEEKEQSAVQKEKVSTLAQVAYWTGAVVLVLLILHGPEVLKYLKLS
jgi:septal ring factor EnvC (AmiA/AmiB activator)